MASVENGAGSVGGNDVTCCANSNYAATATKSKRKTCQLKPLPPIAVSIQDLGCPPLTPLYRLAKWYLASFTTLQTAATTKLIALIAVSASSVFRIALS